MNTQLPTECENRDYLMDTPLATEMECEAADQLFQNQYSTTNPQVPIFYENTYPVQQTENPTQSNILSTAGIPSTESWSAEMQQYPVSMTTQHNNDQGNCFEPHFTVSHLQFISRTCINQEIIENQNSSQIITNMNMLHMHQSAEIDKKFAEIKKMIMNWKEKQSILSIGPIEVTEIHNYELRSYFNEFSIQQQLNSISELFYAVLSNNDQSSQFEFKTRHLNQYLSDLFVINLHPPYVYVCGTDVPASRSKYWFNIEAGFLETKFLRKAQFSLRGECYLEEKKSSANQENIYFAALNSLNANKKPKRETHRIPLQFAQSDYSIKFEKLAIEHFNLSNLEQRICLLCFKITMDSDILNIHEEITIKSLPITVLTNKDDKLAITAAIHRVQYDNKKFDKEMATIFIEMLFQAKLKEEATLSKIDFEFLPLSTRAKNYLFKLMIGKSFANDDEVDLLNLNRIIEKNKDFSFSFVEWLFAAANIICAKKSAFEMWNKRLIYGFCSRKESQIHLKCCKSQGAILIRITNREMGKFSVDTLNTVGELIPSPISKATIQESKNVQIHFAELCNQKRKVAVIMPAKKGYFGSKYPIIRWLVNKLGFLQISFEEIKQTDYKCTTTQSTSNARKKLGRKRTKQMMSTADIQCTSSDVINEEDNDDDNESLLDVSLDHIAEPCKLFSLMKSKEFNSESADSIIVAYKSSELIVEAFPYQPNNDVTEIAYHYWN